VAAFTCGTAWYCYGKHAYSLAVDLPVFRQRFIVPEMTYYDCVEWDVKPYTLTLRQRLEFGLHLALLMTTNMNAES